MQPNRPDELARIQAAGGRVVFNNGHRVRGILAMSRALGMQRFSIPVPVYHAHNNTHYYC